MWTNVKTRLSWFIGLVLTSITLVLVLLASNLLYFIDYKNEVQNSEKNLTELLDALSQTAAIAAYVNDELIAKEVVLAITSSDLVSSAQLRSSDEKVLYSDGNILYPSDEQLLIKHALFSPFNENELIGELIVLPDENTITQHAEKSARQYVLLITVNSVLVILVMIYLINRLLVSPVKKIAGELHHLEPGSDKRIEIVSYHMNDEIGTLTHDINRLLDSVETKIREERILRDEVAQLERRFRTIFEQTKGGIAIIDQQGMIQIYNPSFADMLGEKLIQQYSGEQPESFFSLIQHGGQSEEKARLTLNSNSIYTTDLKLIQHESKEDVWLNCHISPIDNNQYEVVLMDISARHRRETIFQRQAERDALTGLYNRRAALKRIKLLLDDARNKKQQYAFMMIDLDGFKPVNDTYGHEAGDRVLKTLANRINQGVRIEDIVARWGGDEFIVFAMLKNDSADVRNISEKLIEQISQPIDIGLEKTTSVGASIGVAIYPDHAQSIEQLTKLADMTMYNVKSSTKGRYSLYSQESSST